MSTSKILLTSAIKIDEHNGTADLYVMASDAEYPVEGTESVLDWPVSAHWRISRANQKWENWKFVSVYADLKTNLLNRSDQIIRLMADVVRYTSEDVSVEEFMERITKSRKFVEVVRDPRIGEYVEVKDLADPSWELYAGWMHSDKGEETVAAVLSESAADARNTIIDYLKDNKEHVKLDAWASSNYAIRREKSRGLEQPLWDLPASEKALSLPLLAEEGNV